MLTITRKDLLLTINDNVIPAMGSSDVPVKFINDTETYVDFLIEPRVGYYINGCPKSGICEYDTSSNMIKIPAEAFKNKGILVIAIALVDNADSNHIEVTKELALEVTPAPNGTVILPETDTWQTAVKNLVEQLYNQDYKPQFDEIEENLHNLVEEAQNQQDKANNQQTQIDNAIDIMGDYEIVQDNPTQIRFKKGDGTYGDTVNLGDNLASKSMVNAGYDTYSGNSYSGSASDYGIEIGKASGNYYQETTNGYQLFDASKFLTTSQGGATITNNGDGSFTISGSGTTTSSFNVLHKYTHEETINLLKAGQINLNSDIISTVPRLQYYLIDITNNDAKSLITNNPSNGNKTNTISQEDLDNPNVQLWVNFYCSSSVQIVGGTIKPMVYQDGDGTWERFTGGEPAPNPNYPLEPKFFEPKHVYSYSKNMFDFNVLKNNYVARGTKTYTNDSITLTATDDDCYDSTYNVSDKFLIKVRPNTKYTILYKRNSSIAGKTYVFEYNINKNMITPYQSKDDSHLMPNFTFTTRENCEYIKFRVGINSKGQTCTFSDFMILEGEWTWETVDKFIPYKGNSTTPLNITLRALPNEVCDTYEDGVITRIIGVIEFDGSDDEVWSKNGASDNDNWLYYISYYHIKAVALSNKLEHKNIAGSTNNINGDSSLDRVGFNLDYSKSVIYINIGYYMQQEGLSNNKDDLKTYLQSNPIKVYYELSTPTTEKVTLPVIPSYFSFTNAWHDSEVEASDLTWNILARQYGSGQTTIKKDEIVLTELDLNTERKENPTTVKVQLQDSEGKVLYLETSSENIYIQSGRFSGKTVQQVLENSIQAISATDEYIEVDVPDSMTQSIDEEFLVDEVDESETETE